MTTTETAKDNTDVHMEIDVNKLFANMTSKLFQSESLDDEDDDHKWLVSTTKNKQKQQKSKTPTAATTTTTTHRIDKSRQLPRHLNSTATITKITVETKTPEKPITPPTTIQTGIAISMEPTPSPPPSTNWDEGIDAPPSTTEMANQARKILDRIKQIANYTIPDVDEHQQTPKNTSFCEASNIVCDPADLLNGQADDTQVQWAVHHLQAFIMCIPLTIENILSNEKNNIDPPTVEAASQEIITYADQSPKPNDHTQSNNSQPIIQPNKLGPVLTFRRPPKTNISLGTPSLFWSMLSPCGQN